MATTIIECLECGFENEVETCVEWDDEGNRFEDFVFAVVRCEECNADLTDDDGMSDESLRANERKQMGL